MSLWTVFPQINSFCLQILPQKLFIWWLISEDYGNKNPWWSHKGHVDINAHDHIHLGWIRVCVRACVCACACVSVCEPRQKKQRTKVQHCSNNSGQLLYMSRHVAHGFQEISVYFTNLIICHLLSILVFKLLVSTTCSTAVFAAACFKSPVIIYSGWASFHPPDNW